MRTVAAPLLRARDALLGRPLALPPALLDRYPELHRARWRVGGLPPRVGGWFLGRATVAGITLWRTVFLSRRAVLSPALLLHELRHVHQFQASRAFPVSYCWESLRGGYEANRFEVDANAFARRLLAERPADAVPLLLAGEADRLSRAEDS
jgi:hypothetical protein